MSEPTANLYLAGFMGVGKTTIGRAVAYRLGFTFCDSDREIERLTGRTIPELFAQEGEAAFRIREREFVERGHPAERCVVACGGGLIVQPGMLELVRSKGVAMCLHASLETILQRTAGHADPAGPVVAAGAGAVVDHPLCAGQARRAIAARGDAVHGAADAVDAQT